MNPAASACGSPRLWLCAFLRRIGAEAASRVGLQLGYPASARDIPRYARHVQGTPRKNLGVRAEKADEHCFLFGVELGADPDLLEGIVVGVERDGLNRLCRLEVAGVALRIWHLLGEALQVGDEGLRFGEGLSILHALHVAFVRVSVRGSDGDDLVGARHLELEVGVVWGGYELGVAWSPQHCVVGSSEPDHLEREGFLSEVGGSPEADRQIELPKGLDVLPGDDPMKGRRTGPDCGKIDLQEPEGLGVDDVEAAASVHEDLGKPDVVDDWIDNERVLPWAWYAVEVVALVEGDGRWPCRTSLGRLAPPPSPRRPPGALACGAKPRRSPLSHRRS
jgi:hypothetical protein